MEETRKAEKELEELLSRLRTTQTAESKEEPSEPKADKEDKDEPLDQLDVDHQAEDQSLGQLPDDDQLGPDQANSPAFEEEMMN